jgi:hypothetical protein
MTELAKKEAFFHVVDSHRWLAASGCAWNLAGPNAPTATKDKPHESIPNIDVMIRDCLLLHARALIKFYKNIGGKRTDIKVADFGCAIDVLHTSTLDKYLNGIEVHLLHLTDWRDYAYRNAHAKGTDANRARPDWDNCSARIVEDILTCLGNVSAPGNNLWPTAFRALHDASLARYKNKSSDWPTNLAEKSHVEQYLISLGL